MDANPYAYVGGDPTNFVDPSGRFRTNCGFASCTAYFDSSETNKIAFGGTVAAIAAGLAALIPAITIPAAVVGANAAYIAAIASYALNDDQCYKLKVGPAFTLITGSQTYAC